MLLKISSACEIFNNRKKSASIKYQNHFKTIKFWKMSWDRSKKVSESVSNLRETTELIISWMFLLKKLTRRSMLHCVWGEDFIQLLGHTVEEKMRCIYFREVTYLSLQFSLTFKFVAQHFASCTWHYIISIAFDKSSFF